jgi:prepilin-type N-terminal cleavage/methylation domain-containing protein
MKRLGGMRGQRGFSLLELLTAAAIFMILCGAAFGLLMVCQKSYQTESQVLNSFQEARLGVDQIVRDVSISGYPPANQFGETPAPFQYAQTPVAWWPGYVSGAAGAPCTIGGNCSTPADFDLIIETNIDPLQDQVNGVEDVEWVRYQLPAGSTTLFRGVAQKTTGGNPDTATQQVLVPFVQNVMNNASAAQIALLKANYPDMFPTGGPVPIFSYLCDNSGALQPCWSSGGAPANIKDVQITLIVQSPQPDATTGMPRLVQLQGRGHRVNPVF